MGIEELKKEALKKAENAKNLASQVEDLKKQVGAVVREYWSQSLLPI